jgi:hypothetical protein
MTIPPLSVTPAQLFVATMTLDGALYGQGLSSMTVSFFFQGSTATVTTNSVGVATASFTAPSATGTFPLSGLFAGTTVYLSTQAFSSVIVSTGGGSGSGSSGGGGTGTVLIESPAIATVSQLFIASATLTQTSGGTAVSSETISFYLLGTTVTAVTNSVGLATAAFTAPATSGTWIMSSSFAGDVTYAAASSTASLTVLPETTQLIVPDVLTSSGAVFVTTATLAVVSPLGPVSGASLQFVFQGATATETTDGFGNGESTFTAPGSSGTYVMLVSYAGSPVYAAVSATATVTVQFAGGGTSGGSTGGGNEAARVAFLSATTDAIQSTSFTATAVFTDLTTNLPVAGRTLNFVFQGSTTSAVTTSSGTASVLLAPEPLGQYPLSVYFLGDSTYSATSATGTVIVGLGLQPADPMNLVVTTQTATNVLIAWNPVTRSVGGVNLSSEAVTYSVELSTNLVQNQWTHDLSVSTSMPTSLTLSTFSAVTWLRVVALTPDGFRSPGVAALELSPYVSPNRVFLSANQAAWVEVPPDANADLQSGGSASSIVLTTISAQGYVFAYQMSVYNGSTYNTNFAFNSSNGVNLVVSIPQAQQTAGAGAAAYKPSDINGLGLYYNTGSSWVLLGGIQNDQTGEVSINLRRTGSFAAGYAALAGSFSLTTIQNRVFTPLSSDINYNRAYFYFQNPSGNTVNIRIFDITGAQVRSTLSTGGSNIYYWDGTDDSGRVVKSGVYIYQIETAGQKPQTGTIAVAK